MMTHEEFQKLTVGDWVKLKNRKVAVIQHFGRFNGKRWVKSSRKRANGAWIYIPEDDIDGYEAREWIDCKIPAPSLLNNKKQ